jgi:hypothetical protein
MSTLGLYFGQMEQPDANALRSRLNELAGALGYVADAKSPTAGQGLLAALLVAIDAGEVALVLLPDEQQGMVARWLREQAVAMTANAPLAEALSSIAASLEDAADRERAADAREIEEWSQ